MNQGFADTLRALRRQQGLNTEALATKAGVERARLMEWECGDAMPSPDEFVRLLSALGVSADRLMGDLPDMDEPEEPSARAMADDPQMDNAHVELQVKVADEDYDEDIDHWDEDEDDDDDHRDEDEEDYEQGDDAPEGNNPTWKHVIQLAPFMSSAALSRLAQRAMAGGKPNYSIIRHLAPFLDGEMLNSMIGNLDEGEVDMKMVLQLAPFLKAKTLARLADMALGGASPDWSVVHRLAPFLPQEYLDNLALSLFDVDGGGRHD